MSYCWQTGVERISKYEGTQTAISGPIISEEKYGTLLRFNKKFKEAYRWALALLSCIAGEKDPETKEISGGKLEPVLDILVQTRLIAASDYATLQSLTIFARKAIFEALLMGTTTKDGLDQAKAGVWSEVEKFIHKLGKSETPPER